VEIYGWRSRAVPGGRRRSQADNVYHYRLHRGLSSHTHQVCGALLVVDKETVTCALNLGSHHPPSSTPGSPNPSGPSRDGAEASSAMTSPHGVAAKAPQLNYLTGNPG
jgi:hypothetical protein